MKKSLLFLGMLGLANYAHAQSPWVRVNTVRTNVLGSYNVNSIKTVSPTLCWAVTQEKVATGQPAAIPNTYMVTNNPTGAGDQFDFGSVTIANSATLGNISPVGASATTAVACSYPGSTFAGPATYGGELVKTTNAGQSWTRKAPTAFTGGFCNWVHMFNANTGVALGDPTGGAFEVQRTTDGGETWTRLTSGVPPVLNANEYGNAGSFFPSSSAPGTLWTGLASATSTAQVRVFKTTDFGLTWTASGLIPNIVGAVSELAFKSNNLDGIAYGFTIAGGAITALNVARTSDGGATWQAITPNNTATGSFFRNSIDAVGNTYYSVGPRFGPTPATQVPEDFGTSYSTDGINWTNMTISGATLADPGYFFSLDLIPGTAANNVAGFGGLYTDANGIGGIYKFSRTTLATRNPALQSALRVYPNPSATGVFSVDLGSELKGAAQLSVIDALGRQVKVQALNASAIGSQKVNLDLSGEKSGLYTLQIRTEAGLATQKLVVE